MGKRRKPLFLLAGFLLAIGASWFFLSQREPTYQGRALSQWVIGLHDQSADRFSPEAAEAIRQIGPRAIPWLLRWMEENRQKEQAWSEWRRKLDQYCREHPGLRWLASDRWGRAARGNGATGAFRFVGPEAKHAIPALIRLANNTNSLSCYGAADILVHLGPEGFPPIVAGLTNQHRGLRINSLMVIGRYEGDARPAVPALLQCLRDPGLHEPEDWTRPQAIRLLGRFKSEPTLVVPALIGALKDTNALVRAPAAEALGQFATDAALAAPALFEALDDADPQVVCMAAAGLCRIGPTGWPLLTAGLTNPKPTVRMECASAIYNSGSNAAPVLPVLLRCLEDQEYEVRGSAAIAMWRCGPEAAVALPGLIRSLSDPYDHVRGCAAYTLGELKLQPALVVPALAKTLEDHPCTSVLEALGKFGKEAAPAVPAILRCLSDKHAEARREAARVLGQLRLDPAVVVAALAKALQDKDPYAQRAVADALARFEKDAVSAVPALVRCLNDRAATRRGWAAQALGKLALEPALVVPALTDALQDREAWVRVEAAGALIQFNKALHPAVGLLEKELKSAPDPTVRARAAEACGQVSDEPARVVAVLTAALDDRQTCVVIAAATALMRLGREAVSAVPRLQQVAKDPDPKVRAAAANALLQIAPGP